MKQISFTLSIRLIFSFFFFIGLNNDVVAQVLPQDSLALVALYTSTNGDNWTDNTNWLTDQDVSDWYGITVSNNRVTHLELNLNNLLGTIPHELENLTGLTVLNLERNEISGDFPTEVLNLTDLTELILRNNNFTGSIPDNIDTLANLTTLYLFNNPLNGELPATIGNLSNLLYLRLTRTDISGPIPPEFGNLSSLELLELGNNELTGTIPVELGNLTNLTALHLGGNQLTGEIPPQLGNLVNLDRFFLFSNQLTGSIPPEIGNIALLDNCQLQGNNLTGVIPAEIGNLSNLTRLFLFNNELTGPVPIEIVDLTLLESVQISDNQLTSLPDLSPLTALTDLYIQDNQFTFKDIEKNITVAQTFIYSPQDSIGILQDTTINIGDDLTFEVSAGGISTVYQWIKDELDIQGATDSVYTITTAQSEDSGVYWCRVVNTVASELTLYSRPVTVKIVDPAVIENKDSSVPNAFVLRQNYPNPFNPLTLITYQLPKAGDIELSIYNLQGQKVVSLVSGRQPAGSYQVQWDATGFASGVYYYRIEAVEFQAVKKMILLR